MRIARLFFLLLFSTVLVGSLSAQGEALNVKAEAHILKVMSEYKNPWAYYPLRRDIFLPSEEEMMKTELKNSYPDNSVVIGPFIFIKPGAKLQREPFVDASGMPQGCLFLLTFYLIKSPPP